MTLTAMSLLRERTAGQHAEVERVADLLAPDLDAARLSAVLHGFAGFWAGTEPLLHSWAATSPTLAARLDWPRRSRAALLAADVATLDGPAVDPAPPVFAVCGDAEALGWLYVCEGSTLGGAIISRRLAPLLDALDVRLPSFTPYAEGPGPMWKAFGAAVTDWVGDDHGRAEAVVAAAVATFDALTRWLSPCADERDLLADLADRVDLVDLADSA